MLELVPAVRFIKRMEEGRTHPALIAIEDPSGVNVEVIAKFSATCDVRGLVGEAIAAMLATDLALPVPYPYLPRLSAAFIEAIDNAEVKVQAQRSSPICFGSRRLPTGAGQWVVEQPIPPARMVVAAEIFAFDGLVENPDRRAERSNILTDGDQIWMYDHEMAFPPYIIGGKRPWAAPGALDHLTGGPGLHAFYEQLKGRALGFDRLRLAWEGISDQRLQEYEAAIPPEWLIDDGARARDRAIALIRGDRDNIGAALTEVSRVLA